ncbi:ABC transporter permease [Patescibacteria group bacterium]|nr:ABC transporter permease [Patescibacteria group bacterium]MBU1963963.1 ABC transporter permease [Patescibacteria group bacterium]
MPAVAKVNNLLKNRFIVAWAYIVKDMKNLFRFKVAVFNFVFAPFLTMISFMMVYSAVFFVGGVEDLGYVQQSNYIIYLLTGFMAYSCFSVSWRKTTMLDEKVMLTLEGILLTPRNRLYIMVGKGAKALFEVMIVVIMFTAIIAFFHPTIDWLSLFYGALALFLVFIIFLNIDFMVSAIGLAEEGISSFFSTYLPRFILIISCVYYPIESIPEQLRFIVYINPAYYGVNMFRSGFMQADLPFGIAGPLIYLLILAIIIPILAVLLFNWILRKWGIKGY